jgi:hypothetical protein
VFILKCTSTEPMGSAEHSRNTYICAIMQERHDRVLYSLLDAALRAAIVGMRRMRVTAVDISYLGMRCEMGPLSDSASKIHAVYA